MSLYDLAQYKHNRVLTEMDAFRGGDGMSCTGEAILHLHFPWGDFFHCKKLKIEKAKQCVERDAKSLKRILYKKMIISFWELTKSTNETKTINSCNILHDYVQRDDRFRLRLVPDMDLITALRKNLPVELLKRTERTEITAFQSSSLMYKNVVKAIFHSHSQACQREMNMQF